MAQRRGKRSPSRPLLTVPVLTAPTRKLRSAGSHGHALSREAVCSAFVLRFVGRISQRRLEFPYAAGDALGGCH